jgi:hypothetical protein
MLRSTAIIREIDAHHKVDARFSPSVQAHRDRQVRAVLGYLEGRYKPVGKWFSSKYGCAILDDPDHTFLFFKNGDPHPVPCGKWMGWPEKHWHISAAKYKKLSLKERATLECKEQVKRYVSKQWLFEYVSFYMPRQYEKAYWNFVTKRKQEFRRPSLSELFPNGLSL